MQEMNARECVEIGETGYILCQLIIHSYILHVISHNWILLALLNWWAAVESGLDKRCNLSLDIDLSDLSSQTLQTEHIWWQSAVFNLHWFGRCLFGKGGGKSLIHSADCIITYSTYWRSEKLKPKCSQETAYLNNELNGPCVAKC